MSRRDGMHRTSSTSEALGRLSELDTQGHSVLSLYLDFDPVRFTHLRERQMQVEALLAEVEHRHLEDGDGTREDRMALREDIARVREILTDDELAAQPARGLAVFCSTPVDLFEIVALPRGVEANATVARRPVIEPLVEVATPERWCLLLISRRTARILRGTRERFAEVAGVRDDVHRRHSQGGWSQARYQRGIEHEVDEHIRGACALLFERFGRREFDRLLTAGPAELENRVKRKLHPDLRARLAGHFEIDVERATPDQAHRHAAPLIEADEREREGAALARLREGMAPEGHAAVGLDEVLALLNERRVKTLLVAHGFTARGSVCSRCARLYAGDADLPCPVDGAARVPCADITERAVELALEQSVEVTIVRHRPRELAEHGPIAALLLY
jgi:peptide chain release factor subunit 1